MAKKAMLVMFLIWTTPLCAKGAEPAEPNTSKQEQQTILKGKVESESIKNDPNVENDQESFIEKIQQVQYAQLLEVHRSYFTVFIQVLSVYLAIMGACFKIVSDNIEKLKNPKGKDGSKTVLIVLIVFSFVASGLFYKGLKYGETDAIERNKQINTIEKNLKTDAKEKGLQINDVAGKPKIKHIGTELLPQVVFAMMFVTRIIIIGWIVMLVQGLMVCIKKETLGEFLSSLRESVSKRFKKCAK